MKKKKKRASVIRNRNAWTMSEAEFKSMIISALRNLSVRWKPKARCIAKARVSRGVYRCELCKKEWPASLPPLPWKKRKRKNILADHISPIVNPKKWFEWYDEWIKRCFIETGFQALCKECHDKKTQKERLIAKKRKENDWKNL